MPKTWLIFDMGYLCHRAYYAMGKLSYGGMMTGVTFGVLKDILHFQDIFSTEYIAFCFDQGQGGHRRDLCAGYKISRTIREERMDDEERESLAEFRQEVRNLRTDYLPSIGFRNIFAEPGYEADDHIAMVVKTLPRADEKIIVTADADLYQLLNESTIVFHPTKEKPVTAASFERQWGIEPRVWPYVKAMAGCSTDDVVGIAGVGELTAARYYAGTLNPDSKAYKKIRANKEWRQNIPLVKLPFQGCPAPQFRKDCVTPEKWTMLADRLGMSSIRNLPASMRTRGFGLNGAKKQRRGP